MLCSTGEARSAQRLGLEDIKNEVYIYFILSVCSSTINTTTPLVHQHPLVEYHAYLKAD